MTKSYVALQMRSVLIGIVIALAALGVLVAAGVLARAQAYGSSGGGSAVTPTRSLASP